MPTLYFDISDIVQHVKRASTVNGIQRVNFEVLSRAARLLGPENVQVFYWEKLRKRFVAAPTDFLVEMSSFDADTFRHHFHRWRSLIKRKTVRDRKRRNPGWVAPNSRVKPRKLADVLKPGDQIVVLGAGWGRAERDGALRDLRAAHGVRVTAMVHDVIPLVCPEHLEVPYHSEFYRWLIGSADYCDAYFANSEHTRKDLERVLEDAGITRPISVVRLAQELNVPAAPPPESEFAPATEREVILKIARQPFVLVVGTQESRKNLWRLGQVWERLLDELGGEMPRLVLAGKPGLLSREFDAWMEHSGNLNGYVHRIFDATDAELVHLYRSCSFTAMVSVYEGWGLPIGESLSFGKTAVVGKNSSTPEVGEDMVEYCDAHSILDMTRAFRTMITDPDHRRTLEDRIQATRLRSWDDVTKDVLTHLSVPG
jgi:hypothetical protein